MKNLLVEGFTEIPIKTTEMKNDEDRQNFEEIDRVKYDKILEDKPMFQEKLQLWKTRFWTVLSLPFNKKQ